MDLGSVPGTPQDAHKPAANGVLAQMDRDRDRESGSPLRTDTALVNGDMGDRSTEQSGDNSPTNTETHTETETHTGEDSEPTGDPQPEQRKEEAIVEQKVPVSVCEGGYTEWPESSCQYSAGVYACVFPSTFIPMSDVSGSLPIRAMCCLI